MIQAGTGRFTPSDAPKKHPGTFAPTENQVRVSPIVFRTVVDGVAGVNEVQTILIGTSFGKFVVSDSFGNSTKEIPFDVDATTLQAAVEKLASIGTGNVTVTKAEDTFTLTYVNG